MLGRGGGSLRVWRLLFGRRSFWGRAPIGTTRGFVRVTMITLLILTAIDATAHAALQDRWAENSTSKRRVSPNVIASRAGSLIQWETDVDVAFRKSAASGKAVFWYVPRLPDTFMDRVKSLDIYMKAGPFSWPQIIAPISQSFIPLVAVPNKAWQRRFNLQRYTFVEPGFLVFKAGEKTSDAKVLHRTDRLTTLHIPWLERMILALAKRVEEQGGIESGDFPSTKSPAWMEQIRQAFWDRNYGVVVQLCQQNQEMLGEMAVERDLRLAMATFRLGQHQAASVMFSKVAARYPDHPLGHKAAAEAQGIGPFVRGFEIHSAIPDAALDVKTSSAVDPTHPVYRVEQLRRRGADFLLSMQDESGGFFDSDYDFGGADSLPNVHVAVTAISGLALLNQLQHQADAQRRAAIASAVVRAARFAADDANLCLSDRDEIFWALAYRLDLWTAIHRSGLITIPVQESGPVVKRCVEDLVQIQTRTGSWFHEYANPFVTATGVMSLSRAAEVSDLAVDTPARASADTPFSTSANSAIINGIRSLARQRHRSGAFPYLDRSLKVVDENSVAPNEQAAAGRMPLCEAAIFVGGNSSDQRLAAAIASSFKHHQNLEVAYKYDDHTDTWDYGGFFFWFDMRGRKQAIELLPKSKIRRKFEQRLEAIVISKSEIDGCYVDSHEIGRCYGTAMALLCLEK